jgi:hypothetical protein
MEVAADFSDRDGHLDLVVAWGWEDEEGGYSTYLWWKPLLRDCCQKIEAEAINRWGKISLVEISAGQKRRETNGKGRANNEQTGWLWIRNPGRSLLARMKIIRGSSI